MNIGNSKYHSIWVSPENPGIIRVIDQRVLPHELLVRDLCELEDFIHAIGQMVVRGAPLIGITGAYAVYMALLKSTADDPDAVVQDACDRLLATRPTASNLKWALDRQREAVAGANSQSAKTTLALENANRLAAEDIATCQAIGRNGLELIAALSDARQGEPVNILTHCNAGWLATVDFGTATAPIYLAHDMGIKLHVWVDETRPRNQGANLTAYELGEHGIPHTVIVDNAGGHLMQNGKVDICIVGTDRTTATGDVCNKIGTYLKALAAFDNGVPFYVALPSSSIDWEVGSAASIPIEERHEDEVRYVQGHTEDGQSRVLITPPGSRAANYGFDITPARLVTGLITEKGVCRADRESLQAMFPVFSGSGC